MLLKPHESVEYQNFLISDLRSALLPSSIYTRWFDKRRSYTILDFGCGQGYVSITLGKHLKDNEETHIYACDYQEDLLDLMWQKIVDSELKRITPFYMSQLSVLKFPNWLPSFDDIVLSFSLSAVEDPFGILESTYQILKPQGRIHVIDWQINSKQKPIDRLFSTKNRLTETIINQWLKLTGYNLKEVKKEDLYFFLQGIKPENP